jgi:putative redox protein
MVAIRLEYEGDLHAKAVHGPSGTELNTDAPKDNQGRGETFSPTDLTAASLGSCMLTTMGIMARTLNLDIAGAKAVVEKEMTSSGPRKIQRLTVQIKMPKAFGEKDQLKLERAAHACPVARSLHPDVEQVVEFSWG